MDHWDEYALFPTIWPPPNSLFIEWTYTIDLNRELFSVDHEIHFPLSVVPDTWIRELTLIRGKVYDDNDSYPKLAVDETHVQLYEKVNCSILQAEVFDIQFSLNSVHEGLCFELVKFFTSSITSLFFQLFLHGARRMFFIRGLPLSYLSSLIATPFHFYHRPRQNAIEL